MNTWTEVLAIVGFFLLRLGVPVAVTIGLAWALRRLDARWQAEAEVERRQALSVEIASATLKPFASEKPCWEQRNCPPGKRAHCPAYSHASLPCWLARREVEGALPEPCYGCGIFHATGGVPDGMASGGMAAD
jgi:hypothetical protein